MKHSTFCTKCKSTAIFSVSLLTHSLSEKTHGVVVSLQETETVCSAAKYAWCGFWVWVYKLSGVCLSAWDVHLHRHSCWCLSYPCSAAKHTLSLYLETRKTHHASFYSNCENQETKNIQFFCILYRKYWTSFY